MSINLSLNLLRRSLFLILTIGFTGLASQAYAQQNGDEEETIAKDSTEEINVRNADISAIVRIFSKKTKRNYILDEKVKGKVSIFLPGRVSSSEAVRILDSVLALKGFSSVPIGENLWKIVPARDAKQTTIPTRTEDPAGKPSAAMVTRLLNLKYVNVEDVKQLLTPLISPDGLLNAYTGANSLILIDSEDNLMRLVRIARSLDVPFSDREMTIIPVDHADAQDIADKLNEILGEGEEPPSESASSGIDLIRARLRESIARRTLASQPNAAGDGAGDSSPASVASTTVAPRARAPKIIADERTNSIIVVADEDMTARIRALVSQLDSELDRSGARFYVYRCQHADAEHLAEVLAGLVGESTSTSGSDSTANSLFSNARNQGRNTNSLQRGNRFSRTQDRIRSQQRTPGRSRGENSSDSGGGTSSVTLSEDVSITADPDTNSLIIAAERTEYLKVLELLKELDVKRRQVLVEAIILEVGVDDSMQTGVDWITSAGSDDGGLLAQSNFGNDLTQLLSDPTSVGQFSIAAASAGSLKLPGITIPTQSVLLRAAKSNQNVNILSSPTILGTDNQDAEIVVGQNVPFLASTSTSGDNLSNTFNQIDRQDVGITLRITPQITSDDFVHLDIFTEVSNVVAATLTSDLGPTTSLRTSETSVFTKDGQMVVIGGLISDEISQTEDGVPFLKDVPVLGMLFREETEAINRKNLLIFITPHIVRDQFDARDLTTAGRDEMERDIEFYNHQPKRREVLRSIDIDRVSEAEIFEGEAPTTILPPKSKVDLESPDSSSPLEIEVPSNSAEAQPGSGPAAPKFVPERAELSPGEESIPASGAGSRFVVLELVAPELVPENFPIRLSGDKATIGVVIPADSSLGAKQFFGVGQNYSYHLENKAIPLRTVGVFGSPSEAKLFYSVPEDSWHTLSPFEILRLGEGPWKNGGDFG